MAFRGDVIFSELIGPPETDSTDDRQHEDLLVPVLRDGERTDPPISLDQSRSRALSALDQLPTKYRNLCGGDPYPVRLEPRLLEQKLALIESARRNGRIKRVAGRNPHSRIGWCKIGRLLIASGQNYRELQCFFAANHPPGGAVRAPTKIDCRALNACRIVRFTAIRPVLE